MTGSQHPPSAGPPAIPLVLLGGSDRAPARLPAGATEHPLRGAKGIALEIAGRPLIDLALERWHSTEAFAPLYVAGPKRLYGERRGDAVVIDTDGSFADNIRASVEELKGRHPGSPIAIATCDVLPRAAELGATVADYRSHAPLDFWFPMVLVPDDPAELGASAWKPRYRMLSAPQEPPVEILPGHVAVVDPEALRLPLVLRCFDLAYRSRNRPVVYRLWLMVSNVVLGLLGHDLLHLVTLRPPTLTAGVLRNGIALGYGLRRGEIAISEIEDRIRRIFVRRRHRHRHPDRRGRLALVTALSLAKDIDTEEEAAESTRMLAEGGAEGGGGEGPAGD